MNIMFQTANAFILNHKPFACVSVFNLCDFEISFYTAIVRLNPLKLWCYGSIYCAQNEVMKTVRSFVKRVWIILSISI